MKKLLSFGILFVLSLLSANSAFADSTPVITVLSPANGEAVKTSDFTVRLSVSNFEIMPPQENAANVSGKGHVHAFLDNSPTYIVITSNSYKFERLTNGEHKLRFVLHMNDHTPYSPSVTQEIKFNVEVGGKVDSQRDKPGAKIMDRKEKLLERLEPYKERMDNLSKATKEKLLSLPPGAAKNIVRDPNFELNLKKWVVRNLDKGALEKAFGRRFLQPEKVKVAEESLKTAKEKLEKAQLIFKEKKDEFKKTKSLDSAKSYLTNLLDALTERVNKIKAKVESSKDLSEDRSKEVLADLDSVTTKISEWKTKVGASKTKEELKPLLKELNEAWKQLDHRIRVHGWRLELEHFAGILNQATHLDNKISKLLAFAEKNNVTITDKETKLSNFESKLDSAKSSYEKSAESFKQLRDLVQNKTANNTTSDRKSLIDSIQTNLKEAKKNLKEARESLISITKDVVSQLKGKNSQTDSGKTAEITEEAVLNPTKIIEGVETEQGQTTVEVAQEETVEL